ncbi:type IV toxin-antitoxin system AbiEi family antitoxin domain-containing protein [Brooklawnia cerclae]|uniref:Transcriptional regulator of viral defense system n=1 Tax=Brooklawnia cerclae TaxID=349934 RepID=A0ABX0SI38_9ACTN|nr:type IV toxin-antitoxin system AbiEi family antitoxin domain-containing protein [Brooklawnia cerclae]NIH58069.1 putative transcriptional regulator of viral defense system [Brooklawnia cerclae]
MNAEVVTYLDRLREIALDQHGYVTSAQALVEDVPRAELSKMVSRGRLDRVAHGVYQVPQVTGSRFAPYMLAVLWTGAPEACLSHETALQAWDISDINPDRIHVAVAKRRRIKRQGGDGYVIHHCDLAPEQVTWWERIPITDVPTTICQCIDWGVPTYLIKQALERAGRTSLLHADERRHLASRLDDRDYGRR